MIEGASNTPQPNSNREATIDAGVAMGIGIALNCLRTIAAGFGALRKEGDALLGYSIEEGQNLDVYITQNNFHLLGDVLLTPEGQKPSERLREVSSRLFELACVVADGKKSDHQDFTILAEEICGYLHDQQKIAVEFISLDAESFGDTLSHERVRIDREALIRELSPQFKEQVDITDAAIRALDLAFTGDLHIFRNIIDTLEERYEMHLNGDRSSKSRWGSCYLGYARCVESLDDMQRFSHYHSRQGLVSQLFSLYCESFSKEFTQKKEILSDVLTKIIITEGLKAEDIEKVIGTPTFIHRLALAELSLKAFKELFKVYDNTDTHYRLLRRITHNLYWHPYEGCSGQLTLDGAWKETKAVKAAFQVSPRLRSFENYVFGRYLGQQDFAEIKTFGFLCLKGNKWARAYRNACIHAVEEVERISPDHFIHLAGEKRKLNNDSIMPFSQFIEEEWQRRKF